MNIIPGIEEIEETLKEIQDEVYAFRRMIYFLRTTPTYSEYNEMFIAHEAVEKMKELCVFMNKLKQEISFEGKEVRNENDKS